MIEDLLAPLMFCTVFLCIFSGYPVALSLGGVSVLYGIIGIYFDLFDVHFLQFFSTAYILCHVELCIVGGSIFCIDGNIA